MDIHANPVLSAGTGNYIKTMIYYIIVSCHFQSAFQLDALDPCRFTIDVLQKGKKEVTNSESCVTV